jgi:hypothetical protein
MAAHLATTRPVASAFSARHAVVALSHPSMVAILDVGAEAYGRRH